MNQEALDALRAAFGPEANPSTGQSTMDALRAKLSPGGRIRAPFAAPRTLLDAPFRADGELAGLDIALLGIPYDLGVTHRAGTRHGPAAIRGAERVGLYSAGLGLSPFERAIVADIGDLPFRNRWDIAACNEDIEVFYGALQASGVRPLAAGGDHSLTYPVLRALGRDRPLGLVHIDAHQDLSGTQNGTRLHHGAPFRNAVLDGVVDPARMIQVGIRGSTSRFPDFSDAAGIAVIRAEQIDALGVPAVIARMRETIGGGPAYLTFDIDSIDPALAPGTGTCEPGGLLPREAMALVRGLAGTDIVAADVVEVAPMYDPTTATALLAAQIMLEIACLMVLAPSFQAR